MIKRNSKGQRWQKPVLQKARKPFGLQYKILKLDSNKIEQTETVN
jgi:hypothetical protein